jgi:predicted transcriptional regulator
MSDTRDRVRRRVHERPGLHHNRLGRELDLAAGQLQYHLRRLQEDSEVVAEQVGGKTHYFPTEFDPWERRALAFLRRESARAIIVRLYADGPTRPESLADELGLARSTISWHVSKLVDHGIVEKSPDSPMTVSLANPRRTAELLEAVSPSLPDRLVDRFVRTVDRFLG